MFYNHKPNNDLILVIDYHKLNANTEPITNPTSLLSDQIKSLEGYNIFSSIDLNSGYY